MFFINLRSWGLIRIITVTTETTAKSVEIRKAWFWGKKFPTRLSAGKIPMGISFQKNPKMYPVTRLFYSILIAAGRNKEVIHLI